jgi:predicted N-acyltransferase
MANPLIHRPAGHPQTTTTYNIVLLAHSSETLDSQMLAPQAKELRFSFFRSAHAAGRDWDAAAPPDNLFLQRTYLSILEANPPIGMRFGYLVFYADQQPVGVALCQIKQFKADENIQDLGPENAKNPCFFHSLFQWLKKRFASLVSADILICGNMLLTGAHGYYFDADKIMPEQSAVLLEKALVEVIRILENEGGKIPAILIKDLNEVQETHRNLLKDKGFVEFDIQPNMLMPLPYADFDAYLQAMSTKYRTRAKRAFKKLDGIEKRALNLADIQRELPRIYALYHEIAQNAGFNMVDLNEHYLPALKRDLPDHFNMYGYYLNGQLLAFYTTIQNGKEMEAHFLGYDKSINQDYQLYLNILYDIVSLAIEARCHQLVFARTALEIKSSVGAVAHNLPCYLRQ